MGQSWPASRFSAHPLVESGVRPAGSSRAPVTAVSERAVGERSFLCDRRSRAGAEVVPVARWRSRARRASRRYRASSSRARARAPFELMSRPLDDLRLAVLMLDGFELKGRSCVVALGIDTNGVKHPLGLWDGSTENATVATTLLANLVERGLDVEQGVLDEQGFFGLSKVEGPAREDHLEGAARWAPFHRRSRVGRRGPGVARGRGVVGRGGRPARPDRGVVGRPGGDASGRGGDDPGRVVRDLAMMLADGGDCLSELRAVRDQRPLSGPVASVRRSSRWPGRRVRRRSVRTAMTATAPGWPRSPIASSSARGPTARA
jgi:hypothetical protein